MENACRICFGANMVNIPIFGDNNDIYLKMSACLPIKVQNVDNLPKRICSICNSKVDEFYTFWKKSLETEKRINTIIQANNVKNPNELQNWMLESISVKSETDLNSTPILSVTTATQTDDMFVMDDAKYIFKPTDHVAVDIKEEVKSDCSINDHFDRISDMTNVGTDDDSNAINENKNEIKIKKKSHMKKNKKKSLNNMYSSDDDNITLADRIKKKTLNSYNSDDDEKTLAKKSKKNPLNSIPYNIYNSDEDEKSLAETARETREFKVEIEVVTEIKENKKKIRKKIINLDSDLQYAAESNDNQTVKHEIECGVEAEMLCCCVCYEFCFNKDAMLRHYKIHRFESENKLLEELKSGACEPNEEGLYICCLCKKTFDKKSIFETHVVSHKSSRRPYRCTLCEKNFSEVLHIFKHGKTHQYVACSLEGCPTSHLGLCPKEHRLNMKAKPKPVTTRYICDICSERFVYMRYLKYHRQREHPEARDRQFVNRCMHCSREFTHPNSLRRHMVSHTGERDYLCYICGKALSSKEHLKFHIRIHTGYKPHICKTCGKGFVKKCNLTLHERVHSGEKPHVCSHCGKAFSQRSTLVIHERYHSGARPYVCKLCNKGFVARGLLSMHLKNTCV